MNWFRNTLSRLGVGGQQIIANPKAPRRSSVPGKSRPFAFYVPAWGKRYSTTFLKYGLPTLLAPGNIPSLKQGDIPFTVYTTKADRWRMERTPIWNTLQRYASVRFKILDDDEKGLLARGKFKSVTNCYIDAMNEAADDQSAAVMLMSDFAISDGAIAEYRRLVDEEKKVIEIVGPRGSIVPIGAKLETRRAADESISIGSLELARLWYENIHHSLAAHFMDGPASDPFYPSHLYWRVKREGIVVRILHSHPIVVAPDGRLGDFTSTTDYGLADALGFDSSQYHLCRDSRTSFCCELSPVIVPAPKFCTRDQLDEINRMFEMNPKHNLDRLHQDVTITTVADLSDEWDNVRKQSGAFIEMLEARRAKRRTK